MENPALAGARRAGNACRRRLRHAPGRAGKKGSFDVEITHAKFPTRQAIAKPATLAITVRNSGSEAIGNVAVTVDSFNYTSSAPELAANERPIWAINRAPDWYRTRPYKSVEVSKPGSAQTAYVSAWALGRLAVGRRGRSAGTCAGQARRLHRPLHGRRRALRQGPRDAARRRAGQGHVDVDVAGEPPVTHVDPKTGKVAVEALIARPDSPGSSTGRQTRRRPIEGAPGHASLGPLSKPGHGGFRQPVTPLSEA